MDAKLVTQVQKLTEDLFKQLSIDADVVVEIGEAEVIAIEIIAAEGEEDNLGLIIGHHGSTLYALQLILSLMINRDREEWLRVRVDVNDYRESRDGALRALAQRSAKKAKFLEEEVALPPMNSFDRRIVHMAVSEMSQVESESIGEEPRRRVVIRPLQ